MPDKRVVADNCTDMILRILWQLGGAQAFHLWVIIRGIHGYSFALRVSAVQKAREGTAVSPYGHVLPLAAVV